MDSLTPDIFVKSINETIKFYEHLGFEVVMTVPEEGNFVWVMMTCENVSFMFQAFDRLGTEILEENAGKHAKGNAFEIPG